MGIVSKLFGSDKVIDGAMAAADKLVYTAEEKRDFHAKMLSLYEPFKLAQRLIACAVVFPYMGAWVLTFIGSFWLDDMTAQKEILSGPIGTSVILIIGFYFGCGAGEGILRAYRKK